MCWAISSLVLEICRGLEARRDWKVAWVSRQCNMLAHSLAQWAASCNRFGLFRLLVYPSIVGVVICFGSVIVF